MLKKFLVLLFFLGLAATFMVATPVFAAESDLFYITVTISHIDIALKDENGNPYGTWEVGVVGLDTTSTMAADGGGSLEEGVWVDNSSNVPIYLTCSATNTLGWAFSGTSGSDQCVLLEKTFATWEAGPLPDMTGATQITGTPTTIVTDEAVGVDEYLYYSLTTPTAVSSYSPNTFTVTVTGVLIP
jgi:hypothetical protein